MEDINKIKLLYGNRIKAINKDYGIIYDTENGNRIIGKGKDVNIGVYVCTRTRDNVIMELHNPKSRFSNALPNNLRNKAGYMNRRLEALLNITNNNIIYTYGGWYRFINRTFRLVFGDKEVDFRRDKWIIINSKSDGCYINVLDNMLNLEDKFKINSIPKKFSIDGNNGYIIEGDKVECLVRY